MALNKRTALNAPKTSKAERIIKKPKPPRRAREWFSGLTNKYGYWDTRFKFKKDRQGRKKLQLWLPQRDGSMKKTLIEVSSRGTTYLVPVKVFYHKKSKRLIVITRDEAKTVIGNGQTVIKVYFRAHSLNPFQEKAVVGLANAFLLARYNYFPDCKVIIGGNFRWFSETVEASPPVSLGPEIERIEIKPRKTSGQTVPPSFISKKAFGLAVNHLRDLDHAKQGITKIFGRIDPSHRSVEFARRRGFRELTEEEKAFLKKVDPGFLTSPGQFKLMVRDFQPGTQSKQLNEV